jgi:hypothetical protein
MEEKAQESDAEFLETMKQSAEERDRDFPYYTLIKGAARAIESVEDSIEQLDQLNPNSELQAKLRAGVQAVCRATENRIF